MAEVSEKSFPFDAKEVNGKYDRECIAEDFARYFRAFISSGVFMEKPANLQIIANSDMTVTLKPGDLIIDGYRYENEADIIIQLDPADGVLNRIDRIAATWSKEDRDIHYTVQKGAIEYEPSPPAARRTAEYKDYVLADVYVAAGAISIRQADITDQRLNSALCGLAAAFCKIDTTQVFNQFMDWFQKIKADGESGIENLINTCNERLTSFEAQHDERITAYETQQFQKCDDLLEELNGLISESAAGELKLEINEIGEELKETKEIIGSEDISGIGTGDVKGAIKRIWELLYELSANGAITEVKLVDALPSDAASHPTTFYWVKG